MDFGLDLLANPSKVKKKKYLINKNKQNDFNLNEFNLKLIKVYPTVSKSGYFYRFLD